MKLSVSTCLLAAALLPLAGCGQQPPKAKPAADAPAKPADEGPADEAGATASTDESMPAEERDGRASPDADATEPGAEEKGPQTKFGEPAEIELPK